MFTIWFKYITVFIANITKAVVVLLNVDNKSECCNMYNLFINHTFYMLKIINFCKSTMFLNM